SYAAGAVVRACSSKTRSPSAGTAQPSSSSASPARSAGSASLGKRTPEGPSWYSSRSLGPPSSSTSHSALSHGSHSTVVPLPIRRGVSGGGTPATSSALAAALTALPANSNETASESPRSSSSISPRRRKPWLWAHSRPSLPTAWMSNTSDNVTGRPAATARTQRGDQNV